MKILKTIKWLLNHPPTGLTSKLITIPCKYCGKKSEEVYSMLSLGGFCYCGECLEKAMDKVLLKKKKEKNGKKSLNKKSRKSI